jgi:hypothetical protein
VFENVRGVDSRLSGSQVSFLDRIISIDQYNAKGAPEKMEKVLLEIADVLRNNGIE